MLSSIFSLTSKERRARDDNDATIKRKRKTCFVKRGIRGHLPWRSPTAFPGYISCSGGKIGGTHVYNKKIATQQI